VQSLLFGSLRRKIVATIMSDCRGEYLMDPKNRRAYTGRSGQRAVLAELLDRGCNAAIPEVDVGRDVFAFLDEEEGTTHIQVKTAGKPKAVKEDGSYTAQIDVPLAQLKLTDNPPLYYVFAMRLKERWEDFIIIRRDRLNTLRLEKDIGSEYTDKKTGKEYLKLTFLFSKDDLTCSGESFREYRNAWTLLPPLRPAAAQGKSLPAEEAGGTPIEDPPQT
jgi:hypothetical protein